MASYSVSSSKAATLVAATVDTVTVNGNKAGVRIQNRSSTETLFYTLGIGTTPTDPTTTGSVDGSYFLPASSADAWDDPVARSNESSVVVKLISAGTPSYTVESWTS